LRELCPAVSGETLGTLNIPMNAIALSCGSAFFPIFFKRRALPKVFYARRCAEVSRLCPHPGEMKASNNVAVVTGMK
jgi:hypothetical protein